MDAYHLGFRKRHEYDPAKDGISLEVTLRLWPLMKKVPVKVDPGSTFCIFQREVGEDLGIDIDTGWPQRIGTMTGSFLTYGHDVTLETLGYSFDTMVYFAEYHGLPRNVVGRYGWMQRFRLGLVDYDGELYLSDYNESVEL